jgi:hypothetical protein
MTLALGVTYINRALLNDGYPPYALTLRIAKVLTDRYKT